MATTWLITGISSGFGRALAELILARGDRLFGTVRKVADATDLAEQYPGTLAVGILDVNDVEQMRSVVAEGFEALGKIDVAVSNAGYGLFGTAEEVSDAQIEAQLKTNLIGSIQLARAVLPHFRAQGHGHFIQIASMGGQVAFPMMSIYHASKWGIEGFCEAMAQEIAPFGLKVTIVEPGGARTEWAGPSGVYASPMAIYADTPSGQMRKGLQAVGSSHAKGDPKKMAQAMIDAADREDPPLRLTLGSDAYGMVSAKLKERLALMEAQKAISFSTDVEE